MNHWLELSIEFATQRNYLDELHRVYPAIPQGIRELDEDKWSSVEKAFKKKNRKELLKSLLALDLFPIKDPYVAFLKRDKTAVERNPATIERLTGRLFEMGLDRIWESCSKPKEINRIIGPLFHNWVVSGCLGADLKHEDEFKNSKGNAILAETDARLLRFAREYLDYSGEKGLDFIGRFNGKHVVGEAKFLTDYGGHQNAQFEDAKNLLLRATVKAEKVAVLDGVLYIKSRNKMHRTLINELKDFNVMSALVLREFLYQL